MIIDDLKTPAFDEVGDPVFSADGKHLAFRALRGGKAFVVCDGMEAGEFGAVSWVGFSPDGKHLAVSASREMEWFVVVDGIEGPAHARVLIPDRCDRDPGRLRYATVDADEVSLVEVEWSKDRQLNDWFTRPAGPDRTETKHGPQTLRDPSVGRTEGGGHEDTESERDTEEGHP